MKLCQECGGSTAHKLNASFCSDHHRKDFNNRRLVRGAELYDLLMAWRYERALAAKLHVWRAACRLMAKYRAEDRDARAGRKSWNPARVILHRHTYLSAQVMTDNAGGARRVA